MRIVIVGQQAFGKAVLDAFLARGDTVAGVFAAPERPGARPDPLVVAAEEKKLPVYRFPKYSVPEPLYPFRALDPNIAILPHLLFFPPPHSPAIPHHTS